MDVQIVNFEDKEVPLASYEEVEKRLPTNPILHKLEAQADQSARPHDGDELDKKRSKLNLLIK